MSIDIEQQQKTLEAKVISLQTQIGALQKQQKQTKDKSLETQIASMQKELKQTKDQLSTIIKIINRGLAT